jgi:hypothetical protein
MDIFQRFVELGAPTSGGECNGKVQTRVQKRDDGKILHGEPESGELSL